MPIKLRRQILEVGLYWSFNAEVALMVWKSTQLDNSAHSDDGLQEILLESGINYLPRLLKKQVYQDNRRSRLQGELQRLSTLKEFETPGKGW